MSFVDLTPAGPQAYDPDMPPPPGTAMRNRWNAINALESEIDTLRTFAAGTGTMTIVALLPILRAMARMQVATAKLLLDRHERPD